jgi:signal transduction histidine kinase
MTTASDITKMLAQLGEATAEARKATSEARAATKDLKHAVREAQADIRRAIVEEVGKQIEEITVLARTTMREHADATIDQLAADWRVKLGLTG